MELLVLVPSDLLQISVSYLYKSTTVELNVFLHVPMVQPIKLLKFFQFIKFPSFQNSGQNFTIMPDIDKDLLAMDRNISSTYIVTQT